MKTKIISGLAAVFLLLLFFVLIPLDVLNDWLTAFAIIGSILFAICIGVLVFSFKPKGEEDYFWPKAIVTFASFWAFGALLIFYEVEREEAEFENNGRYTVGRVVDGKSLRGRRTKSITVTLKYRIQTGEIVTSTEPVSERQFDSFYKGAKVPLVHSKTYPRIVKILKTEEEIAKYRGKK